MRARITGMLLGLVLGLLAWAIIAPQGPVGALMPGLSLGAFEPERFFVGAAMAAFAAVIFVAALMPKEPGGGGSGGGKRRTPTPLAFDMDAPAATPPAPEPEPPPPPAQAISTAHETAALEPSEPWSEPITAAPAIPVALAVSEPPAAAPATSQGETFQNLRERLHAAARAEDWTEAAALSRRLPAFAASDAEHALAAQDLGDLARAGGRLDDAAEAYHDALAYARAAHAAAPADPARIDLLAAALTNVGDIAQDEGRLDAAVTSFEEALSLRRAVVAGGPADPPALRALSLALERLADAREDRGHRMRALDLYKESFDIAGHLASADPARYGADLKVTRERLAELESRIAS